MSANHTSYIETLCTRYRAASMVDNRRAAGIMTSMRSLGIDALKEALPLVKENLKPTLKGVINILEKKAEQKMLEDGKPSNQAFSLLLAEIEGSFAEYEKKIYDSVINQIQTLYSNFKKSKLSLAEYEKANWPPVVYFAWRHNTNVKWTPSYEGENPPHGVQQVTDRRRYLASPFYDLIVSKNFAVNHDAKAFKAYKHKEASDYVESEKRKLRRAVGKVLDPDMIKSVSRVRISRRAKGFEGEWLVEMNDGNIRTFTTRSIIASGLIVRMHYRYISHLLK